VSAREEQVRSLIAQDAADWFVASRAGLTADERNRFTTWLKASPVHVEEYLALEVIGRNLRQASESDQHSINELMVGALREKDTHGMRFLPRLVKGLRTIWPRQQATTLALAALAAVSLGLFVFWNLRPVAPDSTPADLTVLRFETRHGEQQVHQLSDGSVLHLNTDTAVTVRYSKTERMLTLTSGEALFEVAHSNDRPFRVLAGPAEVVDLGTRFDVRLKDTSTLVTLVEGRVAVGRSSAARTGGTDPAPAASPAFVQLEANEQVRVSLDQWPARPVAVDAQRNTAWLHRQIIFENEPLGHVASEFNRYAPKQIEIASPELASIEVSGVFATDNSAAFVAFLRTLDGVQVEVTATRILVSHE
jgi:transmembrane sensor